MLERYKSKQIEAVWLATLALSIGCGSQPEALSPTVSSQPAAGVTESSGRQIAENATEEDLPELPTTHLIAPGETLFSISVKYYGTGAAPRQLLEANASRQLDINDLQLGQELTIPALPEYAATEQISNTGTPPTTHYIQPGETLYSLSVKYYGNGGGVERILEANVSRNLDINSIQVGQKITIPELEAAD